MRRLILAVLLCLIAGPVLAANCIGVVSNAPNCDPVNPKCQIITLPSENTFQVWVDLEPWTAAGIESLRDTRQYYFVQIFFDKDGGPRSVTFNGAFDMIGVGLTARGIRVVESHLSPPSIRARPFTVADGDQASLDLPAGYNQAGLIGTAAFHLYDGANLINRIDQAVADAEFPACQ